MKSQGTDGISRGQMDEGVSVGKYMLQFCPWGKSAIERSLTLKKWILSTFGQECEFLEPSDWFTRGHDLCGGRYDEKGFYKVRSKPGTLVWTPPPAAVDAAIEELRKARLKRRLSTHLLFIPRLATTLWLKQLNKACDIVIYLPNHFPPWPNDMHEPLVIGICFPFLHCRPWQLRGCPKLFALARELRSLLQNPEMDSGCILHKFFNFCQGLSSMPHDKLWRLLFFGQEGVVPNSSRAAIKRKREE